MFWKARITVFPLLFYSLDVLFLDLGVWFLVWLQVQRRAAGVPHRSESGDCWKLPSWSALLAGQELLRRWKLSHSWNLARKNEGGYRELFKCCASQKNRSRKKALLFLAWKIGTNLSPLYEMHSVLSLFLRDGFAKSECWWCCEMVVMIPILFVIVGGFWSRNYQVQLPSKTRCHLQIQGMPRGAFQNTNLSHGSRLQGKAKASITSCNVSLMHLRKYPTTTN